MIGTTLHDRYRLESELGAGAMGVVYRGHDALLDRRVAVKMLSRGAPDSETRARWLREAQAAARLNHPGVVGIYDAGEEGGTPFIVMELVEGPSLRGMGALELPQLLSAARQLCDALEHAHAHGIVHRDLKPENVLVLTADGELKVKLADLGVARLPHATRLTMEGGIVGTALYLAPEQALGGEVDGRTDLYALGAMLYELAAGRPPFVGDDAIAVVSQHLHAPVVPPSTWRASLPPALEAVILKLLAKDPADRFARAHDVAEALAAIDAGAPSTSAAEVDVSSAAAALGQLARGRLIGRRAEVQRLREMWTGARAGQSRLVLLSGEPGVGKTRLAYELMVFARLSGATVLRGGCYEYEATTPYLPFVEALRGWVRACETEELRTRLGASASELTRLAPEIEARLGAQPESQRLSPAEERLRLFDHVARLLRALAKGGGLVLWLDDLHWADQGTLSLLHYLLRDLRDAPVMALAAYREAELDRTHPLSAALVEWDRERLATRIPLGRLSLEETTALLATMFGQDDVTPDFAEALFRETEGNPFFVEEVVKSLIEQGQIYREAGDWQRKAVDELAIPQSVKAAVSRRLTRLSESCAETLHAAAALGKTFSFSELSRVLGGDEDRLLDSIDEAVAAQLLRVEGAEEFVFTHDKIREVLYEELNPIRRRRLHQKIGEALEALHAAHLDAHAQDLSHHFVESGDMERGLRYSRRAGEQAGKVFALDESLDYYQRALECAETLGGIPDQAGLHEAIGEVQAAAGAYHDAIESYQRALAMTSDPARRAAIKATVGGVYGYIADPAGLPFLDEAVKELDPVLQANDLAGALAIIARYHHYRLQHSRAIEFLEQARALAEPVDDPATLEQIYSYLAGAYQHLGRYEESMDWARRCIALGEKRNFPEAIASGHEFLAEDLCRIGRWREALRHAELDREFGERAGSLSRVAWSLFAGGVALRGLGRLDEAAEAERGSLARAERTGEIRLEILALAELARIEIDLGHLDEAARTAGIGVDKASALGQLALLCDARSRLALVQLARGDAGGALELCEEPYRALAGTENGWFRFEIGAPYVQALLDLGRADEAEAILGECFAAAEHSGVRHPLGIFRQLEARLLAGRGELEPARRALEEALAVFVELECPLDEGRALEDRGAVRLLAGEAAEARADFERARELFAPSGAALDLDRIRKRIGDRDAAAGGGVASAAAGDPAASPTSWGGTSRTPNP